MLTYHPAYDPYHCFLRMVSLLVKINSKDFPIDSLRIMDFYLCIPSALEGFRFPKREMGKKKIFIAKKNSYNGTGDSSVIFNNLRAIQDGIFEVLLSRSMIDCDQFLRGSIIVRKDGFTAEVYKLLEMQKSLDPDAMDLLVNSFSKIDLLGPEGLKSRSGLMEYRYDVF